MKKPQNLNSLIHDNKYMDIIGFHTWSPIEEALMMSLMWSLEGEFNLNAKKIIRMKF